MYRGFNFEVDERIWGGAPVYGLQSFTGPLRTVSGCEA